MLLAAVSLFSGCSDDDDLSTQNKGKTKPTVTVTQGTVTDDEFTFTLAASEGAAQYAYVIFEGKDKTAPIAHDIVIDEVSGKYMSGAFNVADAASQNITVPCYSNADYQVFAAAITSTGLLSEVTELKVYIPDTMIPAPAKFIPSGSSVQITYSEDVVVGSTGKATVRYVQWGVGSILAAQEIPMENISTNGNVATIVCPKPADGAGYIVSFTAGLFEDVSGNKCLAITSGWDNNAGKYVNLGWNDANVDFPIEDGYFVAQPEDADYNTPTTTIDFVFPFDVYDAEAKNAVQVIFNEAEGISYLNAAYTLEADKRTVKVALPKVPTATFDVQVAAGAFYDAWGNESAAFTVAPDQLRYANFQVDIKTGAYTIAYTTLADLTGGQIEALNPNTGKPFSANLVKFDNTYYALQANWFNLMSSGYANPILLGTVDYASNKIVFDGTWYNPSKQEVVTKSCFNYNFFYEMNGGALLLCFCSAGNTGTDPLEVTFDEDGYMTDISYFDYTLFNNDDNYSYFGIFDACADGTMAFVPQTEGAKLSNVRPQSSNMKEVSIAVEGLKKR